MGGCVNECKDKPARGEFLVFSLKIAAIPYKYMRICIYTYGVL